MKGSLLTLLTSTFRELIKLGIQKGVTFQEASRLLRIAFVWEAKSEIERLGAKPNVSKVAAMSGLHRREVLNLFDLKEDKLIAESNSLMSRLIGRWLSNKKYCSAEGKPIKLPLLASGPCFTNLVKEISQDLNPYTILFELERLNLVQKDGESVILVKEGFEPRGDSERALALLTSDINQLIKAVSKNIQQSEDPPNLHITTSYNNINADNLPEIRDWILREGAIFHKKLRSFLAEYDRDLNPLLSKKGKSVEIAVGSFSNFEEIE